MGVAQGAAVPAAYAPWDRRQETRKDKLTATPLAALAALLDHDDPEPKAGDAAAPLAHYLYFLPIYRESDVGPDGHALKGSFMPPVELPSRMWAGSRLEFVRPLVVGSHVRRTSTIKDITAKQGRSGPLVFVTVRHAVSDEGGLVLSDEHDIVYRSESGLAPRPDPVLLFRYSAVTFNSHRIHYDQPYATRVEGYPGLVVHGSLIATLLVDLLRRNRPDTAIRQYRFRAFQPLFDNQPFQTCGSPDEGTGTARLWTRNAQGALTMEATATWQRR